MPGCVGPTWEAAHGQGSSPAPVVREQDQHGLLALVVVSAGCELQRWGLKRAPTQALDRHQQTLIAAFVFHPVTNLGNQTGVTMAPRARTCTLLVSLWQVPGQQTQRSVSSGVVQTRTPPRGHSSSPSHGKGPCCSRATAQGTSRQEPAPALPAEQWDQSGAGWSSPLGLLAGVSPPLPEALSPPPPPPIAAKTTDRKLHWNPKGCWG